MLASEFEIHSFTALLTDLAKMSGRSSEEILREQLAKIGESLGGEVQVNVAETAAQQEPLTSPDKAWVIPPLSFADENVNPVSVTPQSADTVTETIPHEDGRAQNPWIQTDLQHLSTPEEQCVVVEHIVKSKEVVFHTTCLKKLKPFSGRVPHSAFEVNYDAWHSSVDFCLNNAIILDTQVVRKIVESLSPLATNVM